MVTTTVSVTGGTDTYSGVTITYVHLTAGLQRTFTSSTPGPTWTDSGWRALPIGEYTITATDLNEPMLEQMLQQHHGPTG